MDLRSEPLKKYKRGWKKLYRRAFPAEERAPFRLLKKGMRSGECEALCWTVGGTLAALTVLLQEAEFRYLFFFAVAKERRGEGIGSAILKRLGGGLPLVLDAEAQDGGAQNARERERRKKFYLKNGFSETGVLTTVRGVTYEAFCRGGDFPREAFLAFAAERARRYRA